MKRKKVLRQGYTTGTCAAIAAKAAALMAVNHCVIQDEKRTDEVYRESIIVPKGLKISADIHDIKKENHKVSCAVRKDAGDDPDVTNGILIYAQVELIKEKQIMIDGGIGVGTVTKAGLPQKIGEAAINPVPKKMIEQEVRNVLEDNGYFGGAKVIISVPEGENIAKKTFNPRLGIVNGISILGTSGIVEPMSEQALIDTISVEMKMAWANGIKNIIITPGNYGEDFIRDKLCLDLSQAVKCSNFVGESIDLAVDIGFDSILMIGHIGKFVKLAAGIMNTHSHQADGRMEVFTAHAAVAGAPIEVVKEIMECISTDEAVNILTESGFLKSTMEGILKKIEFHLRQRCVDEIPIGAVLFSNVYGILGMTSQAEQLLKRRER